MTDRQTIIGFILTGAFLLLLFLFSFFLEGASKDLLLKEGGLIESASAIGYFLCAATIIYKGGLSYLKERYYLFIIIVFFMLRELDFDKKFGFKIFKLRSYTGNTEPFAAKVLGAIVVFFLLYLLFKIIHVHAKDFFLDIRKGTTVSVGVFIAGCLIVVSKSLDGLARKLAGVVEISKQTDIYASALEEVLELGIPIILFLTILAYFQRNKARKDEAV